MLTTRSLLAIVIVPFAGLGLVACQTPNAPLADVPHTSVSAVKPKALESAKPVSADTVRLISANCFSCHASSGQRPDAIPSLVNLTANDIVSRLKGFKNGSIMSTVMGRHAKAYSDAEIEATAEYIAGLNAR